MKKVLFWALLTGMTLSLSAQSDFINYESSFKQMPASPGATDTGLYGFYNPAMASTTAYINSTFSFSSPDLLELSEVDSWGWYLGLPNFSLGFMGEAKSRDNWNTLMRVAGSFGHSAYSMGLAFDWDMDFPGGDGRPVSMGIGSLMRPLPYVSWGIWANFDFHASYQQFGSDLAIRPFGNKWLTVFGDYWLTNPGSFMNAIDPEYFSYSFGGSVEIPGVDGVSFSARYFPEKGNLTLGGKYSMGFSSTQFQSSLEGEMNKLPFSLSLRAGGREKTFMDTTVYKKSAYVSLNLLQGVSYHKNIMQSGSTLLSMLKAIDNAKKDPRIAGIKINTSGMYLPQDFYYELREKLLDFKSAGKKIVMYIDRGNMNNYYLASCADHVVMDPLGMMSLRGYAVLRTYYKGALEKVGVGFDEYRLFDYKSANESFSRTDMSAGEQEQWEKYLNVIYTHVKAEIMKARNLSSEKFELLVNDYNLISPQMAIDSSLVDSLGRWEDISDIINDKIEGRRMDTVPVFYSSDEIKTYDEQWGKTPAIALVYVLGVCDMDSGIRARYLKDELKAVREDAEIKAVVIRVDSPGGDALASDLVAEEILKMKDEKPVVISQGYVAASGGYWLSMYGDYIYTTPFTLTGSIGVAGGWLYNNGLKEEWGISTDKVQVGKHADMGYSFSVPFLGGVLPDRNLTEDEKQAQLKYMRDLYDVFLQKVSEGRAMDKDTVNDLGQGRIWSGPDAVDNGLADGIGGLEKAIVWAKKEAGIDEKQKVNIIEFPKNLSFNINVMDFLVGSGSASLVGQANYQAYFEYLRKNNGIPQAIMSMENMSAALPDGSVIDGYFDDSVNK
ncbi:MAG: S49 family peptidase [Spirochaetales bacterium]|nr:S49 family peptidase [Spirochaetales bacterium]